MRILYKRAYLCGLSREQERALWYVDGLPLGQHLVTVMAMEDGSASVYTSGTFGLLGGIGHERVRNAAIKFVTRALPYYTRASPSPPPSTANNHCAPPLSAARFHFLSCNGVRFIDAALSELTDWQPRTGAR
jgi:hypothetical protein